MIKADKYQETAIKHDKGPMLVLAGPGSGKTFVITKRIEYLYKKHKVSPNNILVITFTKTAASEMRERFMSMNGDCRGVTFGTFHAVFFMVLKMAYHYTAENILKEDERFFILKGLIKSLRLDYEDENEFIASVGSEISFLKNSGMDLHNYYPTSCGTDIFRRLFVGYDRELRRLNKIDFDDMLSFTYELFSERKDILRGWQNKYQYILIDEFQDVNRVQYEITKLLAGDSKNLFMVGDDDQSIYRFRGAEPSIMLGLKKDFPEIEIVNLKYNYRCPSKITKAAGELIAHNKSRYLKEIIPAKSGGMVSFMEFSDQWKEYEYIIMKIKESEENGEDLKDTAILFRTNTGCRLLAEKLMEYNIPFDMKDALPSIYDHWLARDMFAYLDIAHGSRKREDFLLVMNRPKRYLSRESLEYSEVAFDVWQNFYKDQPWIEKRIEDLWRDIKFIEKLSPYAAINYVRKAVGYDDFIKEYATLKHIKAEELFDILDELMEGAKPFETYEKWLLHILEFKKRQKEESAKNKSHDGVSLLTFHSAKGLEYDNVFIIDVNEDVIPYKKAVLPEDIEEERRMFYVGMTRAISKLFLLSAKKIHGKESYVSEFIDEMNL